MTSTQPNPETTKRNVSSSNKEQTLAERRKKVSRFEQKANVGSALATIVMLGLGVVFTAFVGEDYYITNILLVLLVIYAGIEALSYFFHTKFPGTKA